jgi:hypothetical protein
MLTASEPALGSLIESAPISSPVDDTTGTPHPHQYYARLLADEGTSSTHPLPLESKESGRQGRQESGMRKGVQTGPCS